MQSHSWLCTAQHCFLLVGESPRRHPANTLALTQLSQRVLPAMKVQRDSGRLARIAASDLPALRSLLASRAGLSLQEDGPMRSGQVRAVIHRSAACGFARRPEHAGGGCKTGPGIGRAPRQGVATAPRRRREDFLPASRERGQIPPVADVPGSPRGAPSSPGHGRHDRARTIEHMFPCSFWSLPKARAITQEQLEVFVSSTRSAPAARLSRQQARVVPAPTLTAKAGHPALPIPDETKPNFSSAQGNAHTPVVSSETDGMRRSSSCST
jgi:hypothetical protein